jgi:hypothetical protein
MNLTVLQTSNSMLLIESKILHSLGLVISSWSLVAESDPCETPAQGKGAYQLNSRLSIATS